VTDWVDTYARHDRYMEALNARVKADLAAAAKERERTAEEAFLQRVTAREPDAVRIFIEREAATIGFTVRWTANHFEWLCQYAGRFIAIPPPIDDESIAVGLHELAHAQNGPCPQTPPHQEIRSTDSSSCLACENRATARAETLIPFSRAMFARLRRALSTYRDTPAPISAQREADRIMSTTRACQETQKQLKREMRLEWLARTKKEIERDKQKSIQEQNEDIRRRQERLDRFRETGRYEL
jgi:hypothetical protein